MGIKSTGHYNEDTTKTIKQGRPLDVGIELPINKQTLCNICELQQLAFLPIDECYDNDSVKEETRSLRHPVQNPVQFGWEVK